MIFHLFIISSAVQIYEFSYIHYHLSDVLDTLDIRKVPPNIAVFSAVYAGKADLSKGYWDLLGFKKKLASNHTFSEFLK